MTKVVRLLKIVDKKSDLPQPLRRPEDMIRHLPNLTLSGALRLDISLHEISNRKGRIHGGIRKTWIKALNKDTTIKKEILTSFETNALINARDWNRFWKTIYGDRNSHYCLLRWKGRIHRAYGNKDWHRAWIQFYDRLELELLVRA